MCLCFFTSNALFSILSFIEILASVDSSSLTEFLLKSFTYIPAKSLISFTNFPDLLTIGTSSPLLFFTNIPGNLFFIEIV